MKKGIIFLLIIATFGFSTPQKERAFDVGEWFKFRIHYGLVNAGYATVEVQEAVRNNKKVYHAIGKGYTTGMSRFFLRSTTLTKVISTKKPAPRISTSEKSMKAATLKTRKGFLIKQAIKSW